MRKKFSEWDYMRVVSLLDSLEILYSEDHWEDPRDKSHCITIEIDESDMCSAGHVGIVFADGKFVGFSSWE